MAALEVSSKQVPATRQTEASAPRKRRKRTPAAGAADDCFTCTTRSIKCDRRRPYCSQCLNDGKDCSGYKTQLTWGNGVASRGKLRGLTLPIAGTTKTATPIPSDKPGRRSSTQLHPQNSAQHQLRRPQLSPNDPHVNVRAQFIGSPVSEEDHAAFQYGYPAAASGVLQPTFSHPQWRPAVVTTASPANGIKLEPIDTVYRSDMSTTMGSPLEHAAFRPGLNPVLGFGVGDRLSPGSYSAPSPDSAYLGRVMSHGSGGMSSSLSSYPVSPHFPPYERSYSDHHSFSMRQTPEESYARRESYQPSLHTLQFESALSLNSEGEEMRHDEYDKECVVVDDNSLAVGAPRLTYNYDVSLSPFAGMGAIGSTPRMQYLINYYTEVISPVIVAFDGPSNPYRTQILRLAAKSETLQHAISALAASNLRQRRETGELSTGKTDPARRSSMAHLTLTNESWHNISLLSPQEQAREEMRHKGIAIQSLNKQLANPSLRKDDSILATLLILCLFHICDSGVAKFQTQFAGVRKLLGLRKNELDLNSKEIKWFIKMFTWFDAFTATVNDREGQLQEHYVDICALSEDEWALENLAGCDGKLFKIIARLGRLNVLAQGKPVESYPAVVPRPMPRVPLSPDFDYGSFDGNGWVRIAEDENLFVSRTAERDAKTQFWREWREIRQALQKWHSDMSIIDSNGDESPLLSTDQRVDLQNISESFRCAALLYTERLANPTLPSSDPCIRSWVQRCLVYLKAVKADVYLLWPLFITGSECIEEQDRNIIRERCLDIQKDSGFLNNKSSLELLEKVWKRADEARMRGNTRKENEEAEEDIGLRFSSVMKLEGNEGEYIVV